MNPQEAAAAETQLNTIKQQLNNGVLISHILNIKVSNEPTNAIGTQIRSYLFQEIQNKPLTRTINLPGGVGTATPIITWQMPGNLQSSDYYFTVIQGGGLSDFQVAEHTKKVLRSLIYRIKETAVGDKIKEMEGYTDAWGIAFSLSKPLTYEVPLGANNYWADLQNGGATDEQ
eukprot:c11907_g1_i1.p1 GENE.c11907_g1_i1~~c11907_g1_i1.p1  ORF type:complete len:173 (+),score=27.80 c11907_g1_i1:100-618(+)